MPLGLRREEMAAHFDGIQQELEQDLADIVEKVNPSLSDRDRMVWLSVAASGAITRIFAERMQRILLANNLRVTQQLGAADG